MNFKYWGFLSLGGYLFLTAKRAEVFAKHAKLEEGFDD